MTNRLQRTPPQYRPGHWFHVCAYQGGSIPPRESFVPVDGCDITTGDAKFISDRFQRGQSIVFMLFPPEEQPIFVLAEVLSVVATRFGAVYEPVTHCEFTDRIADHIVEGVPKEVLTRQG